MRQAGPTCDLRPPSRTHSLICRKVCGDHEPAHTDRRKEGHSGNPYRAKAYVRAAESLGALTEPLDRVIAERRLKEIPGVHPSLEAMRKDIPAGVLEMLTVPGLRPDKIVKLYKELGIRSLAELEAAARAGRLKTVKGLKESNPTSSPMARSIIRRTFSTVSISWSRASTAGSRWSGKHRPSASFAPSPIRIRSSLAT
jgi:hypothetical protein